MEPTNMLERFHLNNCRKIFNKFLEINIGVRDVTLMGDDGTIFKCHRFVLSACSPFFERAFANYATTKDTNELVLLLATYKSKNVQRMVDYIYHGKLPDHLYVANDKDIDEDFIRLANDLKVTGLLEVLLERKQKPTECNSKSSEISETAGQSICDIADDTRRGAESLPLGTANGSAKPESANVVSSAEMLKSLTVNEEWLRRLSKVKRRLLERNQTLQDKNPHELLNEIIEGVKYRFLSNANDGYECLAEVEGKCFSGKGPSLQDARSQSIKVILRSIFNIDLDAATVSSERPLIAKDEFGDTIEKLILDKYKSIMSSNGQYAGYKVIAGVVKSIDDDRLTVVSIGTGSKFLYEKNLNSNGNAVHDTHAEVVARRGFIRYIYNQTRQYIATNPSKSIFEEKDSANGKFRLKSGIKFHLYVSTAPCGDARVHSHVNGKNSANSIIPEGQLRTKGQGALTIKKDATSLEDIRNVNMSCSAKLLRWNMLGVQGALLSELIEPIYFASMIFGEKFEPVHMKRALYGRIETDAIDLPGGFKMVQPVLLKVSVSKSKSAPFSPNHSVNWNINGYDVEIVESTSGCTMGKDKTKLYSRISKRAIFSEFVQVARKLNRPHALVYSDAKHNAADYQMAKSKLFKIFENNELGTWVQKRRRNLDNFTI